MTQFTNNPKETGPHRRALAHGAVWAALLLGVPIAAQAQWITPALQPVHPAGSALPVATDSRTPIQQLPFVIDEPGSYVVTRTLFGVAGEHGITINAANVTIDLNGFALLGVPGSLTGIYAPNLSPKLRNVVVRNGIVADWGASGVLLAESENCQVTDLRVSGNGVFGIFNGWASVTSRCTAFGNSNTGISSNDGNTFRDCVSRANTGDGFLLASGSVATNCSSTLNGSVGFRVHADSTLRSCHASFNASDGFFVLTRNSLAGCSASVNGGRGILLAATYNRVEGCNLVRNGMQGLAINPVDGISNFIVGNSAGFNTGGNYADLTGNQYGIIEVNPGPGFTTVAWANFSYQ